MKIFSELNIFHKHKFDLINTKISESEILKNNKWETSAPMTFLTYICNCGKTKEELKQNGIIFKKGKDIKIIPILPKFKLLILIMFLFVLIFFIIL